MVEAAGIEPLLPANTNPKMVHDFGSYDMKTSELPRRFESPGVPPVPWSPPQSWRYFGDAASLAPTGLSFRSRCPDGAPLNLDRGHPNPKDSDRALRSSFLKATPSNRLCTPADRLLL